MWGSHLGNDDANDFERVTERRLEWRPLRSPGPLILVCHWHVDAILGLYSSLTLLLFGIHK
jgi:hypothetical protein